MYGTYTIYNKGEIQKGLLEAPPGRSTVKKGGFSVSFSPLSERSMMYLHSTIRRDSKWSS